MSLKQLLDSKTDRLGILKNESVPQLIRNNKDNKIKGGTRI